MRTNRLEAFSDGVIAIIITIMVLELRQPEGTTWSSLRPLLPVFLSYLLSFVYVGIYWNNHHHLFHAAEKVTASVLWANLSLLFFLSLIPFATAWKGEHTGEHVPTGVYGMVLAAAGLAYFVLSRRIIASQGESSVLRAAVGSDTKGVVSLVGYLLAIALSFVLPFAANVIYLGVALMWLVPDRRIERALAAADGG